MRERWLERRAPDSRACQPSARMSGRRWERYAAASGSVLRSAGVAANADAGRRRAAGLVPGSASLGTAAAGRTGWDRWWEVFGVGIADGGMSGGKDDEGGGAPVVDDWVRVGVVDGS